MESGCIDVLMFSVNPCYDLLPGGRGLWNSSGTAKSYARRAGQHGPAARSELYETCQRLGVGITVMKAFGGGDLLSAELSPPGRP